ncbi:MAG: YiiX/YebB-like N1pC/P60 family cysteine hydrolase [Bacteroidota bacterium]|nr:YiiX/YebB-like N1pC/P60 family cysteine hydrolase [Bacteroidota bacterium]
MSTNPIIAVLLLAGLFLLGSCQTYKYGYWGKLPNSVIDVTWGRDSAKSVIQSMALKKHTLNKETYQLSDEITNHLQNSDPIPMFTFNSLFRNLHEQYSVDTVYHQILQQSPDDSARDQSKQALLESALNYKKAFQKNRFLRRTINRGDLAYGIPANTLSQTQQFLWSDKMNRSYLVEHEKDERATHTIAGFLLSNSVDNWQSYLYKTVYFLSKIFGQFAGQFHGKIDKKTNAMLLRSHLQEYDIVLQKSLTHLTEKFIPGYFGHVGVYLGNDLMIETPRSGVRICPTEEFSNGEIYLIVRPVNLSEFQKQKIRASLMNQLGKKYDFNFDSQSPDRIVCSDLVCLAYDYVDWQTKMRAGHYITSPDDLVRTMLDHSDFSFEMYLNQGQYISKPDSAFIQELLKKN